MALSAHVFIITALDHRLLHKVLTEIKGTDYKEINSYVVIAAIEFEIDKGLVIKKENRYTNVVSSIWITG